MRSKVKLGQCLTLNVQKFRKIKEKEMDGQTCPMWDPI